MICNIISLPYKKTANPKTNIFNINHNFHSRLVKMWKPAERILITPTCHQMSRQREAFHAGQILYMFNDLAQFSKDAVKILMAFDSKRGAFWTFSQQPYSHETALST